MTRQYTIQEAAELTQLSAHTLRFYERIGLLRTPRAENGHRRYSDNDLGWVRFVMLLRGTDMPLPEIAAFMQLEKEGQATIDKRLHMLEAHRAELVQHIAELQTFLSALDTKIDYYRHTTSDICDCVSTEQETNNGIPAVRSNGDSSEYTVLGIDAVRQ
jgi:DNA-binding transcriptional MerR regulator